eukprot:TRINITY_DN3337_c0_g2_i2.p1 TRINITY_DN3337_c0_g2~~TRINITY_DN3337_c0_g2_i2.p1  ORF type:complete len:293 (-),score=69.31 TRINITY_DN3337_c0_g2_i2:145-1023(-)
MEIISSVVFFFFQAEDGIRDLVRSRGLGDVYKRQALEMGVCASCSNSEDITDADPGEEAGLGSPTAWWGLRVTYAGPNETLRNHKVKSKPGQTVRELLRHVGPSVFSIPSRHADKLRLSVQDELIEDHSLTMRKLGLRHGAEVHVSGVKQVHMIMTAEEKAQASKIDLIEASFQGHEADVRLCVKHFPDRVNTPEERSGHTPLIWASENGHDAIVRLLLDANANVKIKTTAMRFSALHRACAQGHLRAVDLLLGAKAVLDDTDMDGRTALMFAREKPDNKEVIALLKKAGAR